ncbi:MAG TPA: DMT family transporter [Gaiellaceae bacterium]|nr:DMT family transporter [Gaiellaceae bacterium]
MTGPLLALTASLSWGLGDFLAGLRTRRLPVVTVLVVSQAAGLTTIALAVALRGAGPPDGRYLVFGSLAGVAGAVGLAALYRGLAVGPMSIVAPISGTAAVVPVVAGLVTGERPSAAQAAGIALAVVGVVLASRTRAAGGGHAGRAEGVGLALVAALAFGLLLVALGEASEGDPYWGTLAMRGASFALLVLTALVLRPSFALRERDLPVLLLIGVLDTAGNALFAVATTKSLLALAAVLAQLYPVVTVLLARVILGERISRGQGIGVVSAFAGVALITAG